MARLWAPHLPQANWEAELPVPDSVTSIPLAMVQTGASGEATVHGRDGGWVETHASWHLQPSFTRSTSLCHFKPNGGCPQHPALV